MSTIPISKDIIGVVIPSPTLSDLTNNSKDIENDIDFLLNWLNPYYPNPNAKFNEPSLRVKSAIRSCLKDDISQLDFVRLYMNSINDKFKVNFDIESLSFLEIIKSVRSIKNYYDNYLFYLNLNKVSRDLFSRNLNSLFYKYLIRDNNILDQLRDFLNESLFCQAPNKKNLSEILKILISINLTNEINLIIIELSIKKIIQFIVKNCSGIWNKPLLEIINNFIKIELYPNFNTLMKLLNNDQIYLFDLIKIAHDELVSLRIKEIFKIVINYPNSKICLFELYQCLSFNHNQQQPQENYLVNDENVINLFNYSLNSQSYQRAKLVDTFIELCYENLLHSGANTIDVITSYTKTIKSFLIIDPKGVLLDKVVRPIRRYLKTREDIIIKLVHGLLDDSESNELIELAKELRKTNDRSFKKKNVIVDDLIDLNWTPDPIDALPDFKKGKVTDIIESLISIFDSKEIFIDEFTKLFGERLINLHDYNVDEINQHLNLLKVTFGKNDFSALDIMIRDIKESKLINEALNSSSRTTNLKFHSIILSHLYWPTIMESKSTENDNFKIPNVIHQEFNKFNDKYSNLKKGRNLKILTHLGLVKLELIINNKPLIFKVTSDKASIISLFDSQLNALSLNYISNELNMPIYVAVKGLQFWVKQNILIEVSKDLFIINEYSDTSSIEAINSSNDNSNSVSNEILNSSNIETSSKKRFDEVKNLYPYINTMLSNLGSLSFKRIKSILSITIPKEIFNPSNLSDNELEEYLDWLVDENKLEISNNYYKLKE